MENNRDGRGVIPPELVLKSRRVVLPEGVRAASVRVKAGRIAEVMDYDARVSVAAVDLGDRVLMPGLVDTHVHVNEPGRTDWEGFATATRAAAAGGITTLVDMPLNCIPPTTTLEALHAKAESVAGRCRVDVGFWGGIVPTNRGELSRLRAAGVFGFKCFLVPSGVPEFEAVAARDLAAASDILTKQCAVLLVHAEDAERIASEWAGSPNSYASYLATRPPSAETEAVERMIRWCRQTRARVHILHLSSADAADAVDEAKREGLSISAETCPHYLTFAAEDILSGATEFKCAPPIRERANRERLWKALADGKIDLIASDHSPAPPARKCRESGNFQEAWGGIASLELSLSAVWTGAGARGFSLHDVARWMCRAPAELAGLAKHKGSIAAGRDADLIVWDAEASRPVVAEKLHQRHKLTPYTGRVLRGVVDATYLRGEKIYERGEFLGEPRGEILLA
jgi:allantoinase